MLSLVTAPASPAVSDTEMKSWLRVTSSAEDDLISGLVGAAQAYLDGADGVLGRALVTQTWDYTGGGFPSCLPLGRVQSITSISYIDSDGAAQTVPPSDYRLVSGDDEGAIELTDGASWPAVASRGDAVTVRYVVGYGNPEDVPAPIRTAVKLLAAGWYENREAAVEKPLSEMPLGFRCLVMPYRVARALI